MTAEELRDRYPRFVYKNFAWSHSGTDLTFRFTFECPPDISFSPVVTLEGVDADVLASCPTAVLNNLAFHLGLAEIPSYWKATCSPEILVEAGDLAPDPIEWWHNLLIHGMGEYFWVNRIDFTVPDFVKIRTGSGHTAPCARDDRPRSPERVLVPIGGGKDSAVTAEILRDGASTMDCMMMNPTQAALDSAAIGGFGRSILIHRAIDPALLRLNVTGYLNGHTPLSSCLAFWGLAIGVLLDYGRIAVSNERSSNEGNVRYLDREINHQYSKSFEFETSFREYAHRTISTGVDFFSSLRPLYEIQIARLFAQYPQYHQVFRSCNRGQKQNEWCHSCPKCLFVYAALYPFLDAAGMERIFSQDSRGSEGAARYGVALPNHDLYEREDLFPLACELLGEAETKPFECVGAHEETRVAFHLGVRKVLRSSQPLPPLLRLVQEKILSRIPDLDARSDAILSAWNDQHSLPREVEAALRTTLEQSLVHQSTNESAVAAPENPTKPARSGAQIGQRAASECRGTSVTGALEDAVSRSSAFAPSAPSPRSVLILGLGREGLSSYAFLRKRYPDFLLTLADRAPIEDLDPQVGNIARSDPLVQFQCGPGYLDDAGSFDLIFKTPGIPGSLPELVEAQEQGTRLTSNAELFLELCPGEVIGVTGTKGKSTTTSMIYTILKAGGIDVRLLGNIGVPPLSVLDGADEAATFVAELSSFQLAEMRQSPSIAVVQNIVQEHLDYHKTLEHYIESKSNLARHQEPGDTVLYNADWPMPTELAAQSPGRRIPFGFSAEGDPSCSIEDGWFVFRSGGTVQRILRTADSPLVGRFNLQNIMPGIAIGMLHGILPEVIARAIRQFQPLEHRLEPAGEVGGVRFYNDSIATVSEAAIAAIETLDASPIVLIAGGYDRGLDFTNLARTLLTRNIRALVLFPVTGARILARMEEIDGTIPPHTGVETMREAVEAALSYALPGDTVLLSPASPSFTQFNDYRDRGRQFKAEVRRIAAFTTSQPEHSGSPA